MVNKMTKKNNLSNEFHKNILILIPFLLFPAVTMAANKTAIFYKKHPLLNVQPEVGVDFSFTKIQFEKDHGDKMLNRNQYPVNIFFGFNFTDNLGIELGYGKAKNKHKDVSLGPGEFAPGADEIFAPDHHVYGTSLSIRQPYLSLKYTHAIKEKLHFFGAIGIAFMEINASWKNIEDINGTPPDLAVVTLRTKNITLRKNIPLIKTGLSYYLMKSFSLRLAATWLQTSKMQMHVTESANGYNPMDIFTKNNIQYSIGIVYSI
jgi:hypothetical protein